MADWILDGDPSFVDLSMFNVERFARGELIESSGGYESRTLARPIRGEAGRAVGEAAAVHFRAGAASKTLMPLNAVLHGLVRGLHTRRRLLVSGLVLTGLLAAACSSSAEVAPGSPQGPESRGLATPVPTPERAQSPGADEYPASAHSHTAADGYSSAARIPGSGDPCRAS